MSTSRLGSTALSAVLVGLLLLSGCSDDSSGDAAAPASPTPTHTPVTAAPPPSPPRVGACYALSYRAATQVSSSQRPVPCSRQHTSVTMFVGKVDNLEDGHLMTLDSDTVADQVAATCSKRLPRFVGGDRETRRLARLQAVWFTPTDQEAKRGAVWFRCDLIGLAGRDRLMPLPAHAQNMLDRTGVLGRYGTCGTSAPDRKDFVRVACGLPHSWRAVATIDLPQRAGYLDRRATAAANERCRDLAAASAANALKFTWSFEWPAREAWRDGQHWGWCWLPQR